MPSFKRLRNSEVAVDIFLGPSEEFSVIVQQEGLTQADLQIVI